MPEVEPVEPAEPVRLPRGRHNLSREVVEQSQRNRMLVSLTVAMSEKGYVNTSVADVLKRAGVSRETFYQMYTSKLDCFLNAFDYAGQFLINRMDHAVAQSSGTPLERFEQAFREYLDVLVEQPALARVFLVEVYAAGPEALERRTELQTHIIDRMIMLLGADTKVGRFACQVIVAGVGSLVTAPLIAQDVEAIRALGDPVVDLITCVIDDVT